MKYVSLNDILYCGCDRYPINIYFLPETNVTHIFIILYNICKLKCINELFTRFNLPAGDNAKLNTLCTAVEHLITLIVRMFAHGVILAVYQGMNDSW